MTSRIIVQEPGESDEDFRARARQVLGVNPVGVEYTLKMSTPTVVGTIPPRTEYPIEQSDKPMGWKVCWRDGAEVLSTDTQEPLKELREGMEVLAPSLFGYVKAIVHFDTFRQPYGETESTRFPFFKATDERGCWVCNAAFNKRVLDLNLPR